MRIDAHQHFWRVTRGDYGWLTADDTPTLYRDFMPADLEPLLRDARIDKTILVQAAEADAETDFLLDVAAQTPFVAGVVGWVALDHPRVPERIAQLAARRGFVGVRPMLQDMTDKAWILRENLRPAFDALRRHSLVFDALVKPPHLPHLPDFIDAYPDMPIVIDHGAKPYIAAGEIEPWATQMRAISRRPNVFCKLSGLVTEAGEAWTPAKLRPYANVLIEAFTPQRLMFGSDWPVLTLASDYEAWVSAADALVAHLTETERAQIFGGAASSFYGVGHD